MSSGGKRIKWNTNERAVSTDMNRNVAFNDAAQSEIWRALLDTGVGSDDRDASGLYVPNATQLAPPSATVAGLLFTPNNGAATATVSAGVLMVLDPDATPSSDDSPYKRIIDPGANLTLTANSSGGTVHAYIECARLGVPSGGGNSTTGGEQTLETDNRDIFNTGTGLFVPTSVTKASAQQLQYRIRYGSSGGGLPALQSGWLPLCVARIPNTAATWDTVDLWDVRPLAGDRFYTWSASTNLPFTTRSMLLSDDGSTGGQTRLSGVVEAVLGGRRIGGRIKSGATISSDPDYLDVRDANNQETGFTAPSSGMYFVYLTFPAGLPRWSLYSPASAGTRQPRSPRGIPVVSTTAPTVFGAPSSALSMANGLGSVSTALCVYASTTSGSVPKGGCSSGRAFYLSTPLSFSGSTSDNQNYVFSLIEGTTHPANARALYVRLSVNVSKTATNVIKFAGDILLETVGGVVLAKTSAGDITTDAFTTPCDVNTPVVRIPIASAYPSTSSPNRNIVWASAADLAHLVSINSETMTVIGWEI